MEIVLTPIAIVKNTRTAPSDDYWGGIISEIELLPEIPEEAFDSIELFSHLEVIYRFNKVGDGKIVHSRRPRNNLAYPSMGIFAQRNKDRPNWLGLTTVELLEHSGRILKVRFLDAIDGTPILDIKPVFKEFLPNVEVRQAVWVEDLMKDYWK